MNKCLCPMPDYIKVPLPHGLTQTVIVNWPGVEVLHGKKADRECEECGQPLCKDCLTRAWRNDIYSVYCPVCNDYI